MQAFLEVTRNSPVYPMIPQGHLLNIIFNQRKLKLKFIILSLELSVNSWRNDNFELFCHTLPDIQAVLCDLEFSQHQEKGKMEDDICICILLLFISYQNLDLCNKHQTTK